MRIMRKDAPYRKSSSYFTLQNVFSHHDLIAVSQGPALVIQGLSHNFHLFCMFLVVVLPIMVPRSTKSPLPLCLAGGATTPSRMRPRLG